MKKLSETILVLVCVALVLTLVAFVAFYHGSQSPSVLFQTFNPVTYISVTEIACAKNLYNPLEFNATYMFLNDMLPNQTLNGLWVKANKGQIEGWLSITNWSSSINFGETDNLTIVFSLSPVKEFILLIPEKYDNITLGLGVWAFNNSKPNEFLEGEGWVGILELPTTITDQRYWLSESMQVRRT